MAKTYIGYNKLCHFKKA